MSAINALRSIESEARPASASERRALLRYTGDEILGVADRAAIPTVLDGVTPGLFHRAPPDARFTNPRYHGRARRPACRSTGSISPGT